MILRYHPLRFAERLELSNEGQNDLHLVHAAGRGMKLSMPAAWIALVLPLRGKLQLETANRHWTLPQRQLLIAREGALHVGSTAEAWWLVLTGSAPAWHRHFQTLLEPRQAMELLPRQWPCPRDLARPLVHLLRCARNSETDTTHFFMEALCATLFEHQSELQPLLDRCNGRTTQRRYHTLARLLRVRQLIERDSDSRLGVIQLAQVANYSPWHLIRMYRAVFGETPSEYAARLRLDRAWTMVRDSTLPVCEITEALGFESESAFCRAFKNAYGLTTTQARHLPAATHAGARPMLARNQAVAARIA